MPIEMIIIIGVGLINVYYAGKEYKMESEKFKTLTKCDWYNVFSKEELILILSKLPDYYGVAVSVLVDKTEKANKEMYAALDEFSSSPTPENWKKRKKAFDKYCMLNDLQSKLIFPK